MVTVRAWPQVEGRMKKIGRRLETVEQMPYDGDMLKGLGDMGRETYECLEADVVEAL